VESNALKGERSSVELLGFIPPPLEVNRLLNSKLLNELTEIDPQESGGTDERRRIERAE
jgi:hypothetical protein